jgi:hypothetical protein
LPFSANKASLFSLYFSKSTTQAMAEIDNKNLFTKINVGSGTDLMTMTRWVLAQQQVKLHHDIRAQRLEDLLLNHLSIGFC